MTLTDVLHRLDDIEALREEGADDIVEKLREYIRLRRELEAFLLRTTGTL